MTRRSWMTTMVLAAAAVLLAWAPAARADEMSELKDRFAKRLPALNQAKSAGTIGETWQGLVEVVDANAGRADEAVRKLIAEENKDRSRLYQIIAERTSKPDDPVTADQVGQQNAARNFKNAKSGEYLKQREKGWVRKP